MADGWEEVSDPNEMRQVLGVGGLNAIINKNTSEGAGKLGPQEAKTAEQEMTLLGQNKTLLRNLMNLEVYNRKIPTGRFQAGVKLAAGALPSGWQPQDVSDYQAMGGMQQRLLRPLAGLYAGRPIGVGEANTPKELEQLATQIPGPKLEPQANRQLFDSAGRDILEGRARLRFLRQWRSKYGSTNKTDPEGRTAEEAFQQAINAIPEGVGPKKPLTTYLDEASAKRTGKTPRKALLPKGWGVEVVED